MPTLIKTKKKKKRILPQKEVLDLEFVSAPSSRHLTDNDLLFNGPSEHDRHILSELWGSADLNMRRPQVNIGKPQQMVPKDPPAVKPQLKEHLRKSDATWPMDLSHVSLLPSHLQQYHLKRRKQPDVSSENDKQESVNRMQKVRIYIKLKDFSDVHSPPQQDSESENEHIRLVDISEHIGSANLSESIHAQSKEESRVEDVPMVHAEPQDEIKQSQEERGLQLESIQSISTDSQDIPSEIMQLKDMPSESVQGLNTEPHVIQPEEETNTQSECTPMTNIEPQDVQPKEGNARSEKTQPETMQSESIQMDNAESGDVQPKEEDTQSEDMTTDSIQMINEEMQDVQSEDAPSESIQSEDIPQPEEEDLSIDCLSQAVQSKEDTQSKESTQPNHAHSEDRQPTKDTTFSRNAYRKKNSAPENTTKDRETNIPHKTQQAEIYNKTQLIKPVLSTFVDDQTKRDRTHIFLRQRQAHIWIINQPKTRHQNCTKRKERLLRKIRQPYIVQKKIKAVHWQVNDL